MRTTLTIEDDIAQTLRRLSHERGKSFKAVVNEVLRRGLTTGEKPAQDREPFRVDAAARGFRSGIDPLKLNQLADELETEGVLGAAGLRQIDVQPPRSLGAHGRGRGREPLSELGRPAQ